MKIDKISGAVQWPAVVLQFLKMGRQYGPQGDMGL